MQLEHQVRALRNQLRGALRTKILRAQPGVAHAWSVADLFFAVPLTGETFGGIPSSRRAVRAILARARDDSAVRLELAPDHRGALVVAGPPSASVNSGAQSDKSFTETA